MTGLTHLTTPGKFSLLVEEILYSISLDGSAADEMGSTNEPPFMHYTKLYGPVTEQDVMALNSGGEDFHPSPEDYEYLSKAGFILYQDEWGFVGVHDTYESVESLDEAWDELEEEVSASYEHE